LIDVSSDWFRIELVVEAAASRVDAASDGSRGYHIVRYHLTWLEGAVHPKLVKKKWK